MSIVVESKHVNESVMRAGSAAITGEDFKLIKNRSLTDPHQFEAVAIETTVTYSDGAKNIVSDIGRRSTEAIGDQDEAFSLMQRLSLAVQRGSGSSIPCG